MEKNLTGENMTKYERSCTIFLMRKLLQILNVLSIKKVWEVQEKAFMAGFGYACKCLSNGKIELGGGK